MHTQTSPNAGTWRLPASLPQDLNQFERMIAQFREGKISATQFQVFRVPQGVYEQRESGTYMLRVRLPAGLVLPYQMRRLAEIAAEFGNGILHVTTRQDIQVHRVAVENMHLALTRLAEANLSTKGGGGNTVRNITACCDAGICRDEQFDVTPHAVGLTETLLDDPLSFQLPRKYKIGFSGCGKDCAGATIQDVGLIARSRDGVDGFAIYAGGGMGATSRLGELLEEFVPASEAARSVEAIKRVFNQHGNRKEKHLARLRFLVRQIGFETFRKLYRDELLKLGQPACKKAVPTHLDRPALKESPVPAKPLDASADFQNWMKASVRPQKQTGFFVVTLPLSLGDISAPAFRSLASVVEQHGEKVLRATQSQNLALRWVQTEELPHLYEALASHALAPNQPPILQNLVACTGASTCKLGICLARGLAAGITDALTRSELDLHGLGNLTIHLSGCPNACGRHPVAQIGLHGAARRVDGRLVPHYVVQFGGRVGEGLTRLATGRQAIPARNVPLFLTDLLRAFVHSQHYPDFESYLAAEQGGEIERLLARFKPVPAFSEDKNFYYDWSATEPFSLAGRGPGECGAGVLDLIEVDLKSAGEALQEGKLMEALAYAARALLVTRGEQAANDHDAFTLFTKHFIQAGLVDERFQVFLDRAIHAHGSGCSASLEAAEVAAFLRAIRDLFQRMDATLQFGRKPGPEPVASAPTTTPAPTDGSQPDLEKDFRGVVCPLNYVKTKMALAQMKHGQVLRVRLDANGAKNVPESVAKDGHEVGPLVPDGASFLLTIRKKG